MPISSEGNTLFVHGELSREDSLRLLAAMHNTVASKGYSDFELNFTSCLKAFSPEMLSICVQCLSYWKGGIDISLVLPNDLMMKRLFLNTGWANLIDHMAYGPSRYRGYTHAPVLRFSDAREQHNAVDKIMDVLLAAISHFRREDLRYIEWVVNELADNVINHAKSPTGGIAQVTNLRQRGQIEFSVCDSGVGIPSTLRGANTALRSDTEALDAAIREGVTRDKSLGQGNGLYGTWRISQKSGGQMSIVSGHASLHASVRDGLQIGDQGIPFNGTLVMARIGYRHKVDLSDALIFAGRRHVPTDYIETHFDQDADRNVRFMLKNESEGFGSRSAGEPVRRKLLNVISAVDEGRAILDFDGVVLVSSSYADEVVGKLFIELGPVEFMRKVQLKNLDPLVKDLVERAIVQRTKVQSS